MSEKFTWVLTEGMAGMVTQAVGLAEAVGLPFVEKTVAVQSPWRWLPPRFWPPGILGTAAGDDTLSPPWPDIVISCGRKAVGPAREIKRRSGGRTFTVHVQDPHVPSHAFDLVIVAAHDHYHGPNVIETKGALHRVTPERLQQATAEYAPTLASFPRPFTTVLVGGANRVYRFTPENAADFGKRLAAFVREIGGTLLVTPSRRTGPQNEAVLREALAGTGAVIWDGQGPNPYFGYLALADQIVVTCDSVSMVSEACATGKPVYVYDLPGGSRKFRRFHELLRGEEITRAFTGAVSTWSYPSFDETARIGAEIRRRVCGTE
jgi:mitochondrial fission protein ELM1